VNAEPPPAGYLGSGARIDAGPAPELVRAGYQTELADAALLHRGLGLADLAHVLELLDQQLVTPAAAAALLTEVLDFLQTAPQDFPYDPVYGDAYNSREHELQRRLGAGAGWVHLGRTRREAGRIAFRMAARLLLLDLHDALCRYVGELAGQAEACADAVWADSTYLQPAQPSTFGHYLGGFGEEAGRHLDRLHAVYALVDQCPAGVGGVGGTRLPLDRDRLAARLGFAQPGRHARDAMWAVDLLADAGVLAAQAATTVDRMAEDFEIFASPAFGYLTLDASLCRASVLMPQKRNPYALAVIRSTTGTLIGRATGLLVTGRTPSARTDNWLRGYGEVAAALTMATDVVALGAEVIRTLRIEKDQLVATAAQGFTGAADLAEELVRRAGLDYRSAYRVVGAAVRAVLDDGRGEVQLADLRAAADAVLGVDLRVAPEVLRVLDPVHSVLSRTSTGSSAPEEVHQHAELLRQRQATAEQWSRAQRAQLAAAEAARLAQARAAAG
jgi:argininosuccinate lyase